MSANLLIYLYASAKARLACTGNSIAELLVGFSRLHFTAYRIASSDNELKLLDEYRLLKGDHQKHDSAHKLQLAFCLLLYRYGIALLVSREFQSTVSEFATLSHVAFW